MGQGNAWKMRRLALICFSLLEILFSPLDKSLLQGYGKDLRSLIFPNS
jgi:hypothetical protein